MIKTEAEKSIYDTIYNYAFYNWEEMQRKANAYGGGIPISIQIADYFHIGEKEATEIAMSIAMSKNLCDIPVVKKPYLDEEIMFDIIDRDLTPGQMIQEYEISKEDFDRYVKEFQEM